MAGKRDDVVFGADLDSSGVLKELRRIGNAVENVAEGGNSSFQKLGKGAAASGLQIGAVSGIVQQLTERLIDLGIEGARALGRVIAAGINLNKEA